MIFTIAGSNNPGDFIPAVNAAIYNPNSLTTDNDGNLYITDYNYRIRRVDAATGIITTIAGTGSGGYSGDGGLATAARINGPMAVVVDANKNVYFSDYGNLRIRKITAATGIITTVAGTGTSGYSGDGGLATAAKIGGVYGLAVDVDNNIYISDYDNYRIRKVSANTGIISTICGTGVSGFSGDGGAATSAKISSTYGIAVDATGNIFFCDINRIRKIDGITGNISTFVGTGSGGYAGDGGLATAAQIYNPFGVVVSATGDVYIADRGNIRIRKVAGSTGIISTVAGNGNTGFSGDGSAATSAQLNNITYVTVDGNSNVYIADRNNNRVRKVDAVTGIITSVAGNGNTAFVNDNSAAVTAVLKSPASVAFDSGENLYIAEAGGNRIRKIDKATGVITTVAGTGTSGYSGDGGAAIAANIRSPYGVAADAAGNLFIADYSNHRIRKVTASTGIITTIAGTGTSGFSGDGAAAISAQIYSPFSIAVDGSGNIFFCDRGNHRIRRVDGTTGLINTIAGTGTAGYSGDAGPAASAQINYPCGIALDNNNNIYFSDNRNYRVRRIDAITGIISSVAGTGVSGFSGDGGPASLAQIAGPYNLDVDGSGNILIADVGGERIRRIDAISRNISTIAGTGTRSFSGDGNAATAAELGDPYGVIADGNGNIYIGDYSNNRIRFICAASTIASTSTASNQTLYMSTNNGYFFNNGCTAISKLVSTGSNPVVGPVADSVWIESTIPISATGTPYVARHYGITPTYNATTASATITLFFTQAEFTAYNGMPDHGLDLPVDAADAANNKLNLRIIKRSGTSRDGTGLFNSYDGAATTISPTSVIWNNLLTEWEVTFDVTGFSGFFVATNTALALPLTLLSFEGKLVDENALLTWKTTDEKNTTFFDVERSSDATHFTSIGKLAAAGSSDNQKVYSYTDLTLASLETAVVYYRLKMADRDGKFTFSNIIVFNKNSQSSAMILTPNPVQHDATLKIAASHTETLQLQLFDQSGRTVQRKTVMVTKGSNSFTLKTAQLPTGVYFLSIMSPQKHQTIKLNKQ